MHNSTKHHVLIILLFLIVTSFASPIYSQELAIRLLDERGDIVDGRVAYPCFDSLATLRKLYSTKELEQTHYRSGNWIVPKLDHPWSDNKNLLVHSPQRELRIVNANQSIDVTLRDPGTQFIRFIDREGKPVSKATLQVVGIQRPMFSNFYRIPLSWEKSYEFITNDQGVCRIPRIVKGHRWLLELKVPSEAPRGMTLTDDEWEGYRKQVRDFVVEPGCEIRLAPKDGDKRLAAGWKARLVFSGPSDEKIIANGKGEYVKFSVETDWQMNLNGFRNSAEPISMEDDRSFIFRNVPDGKYQIRFEHDKFQHQIAVPLVDRFVWPSTANVEYRVDTAMTLVGDVAGLDRDSTNEDVAIQIESIGYAFLGRPSSSGNFEMLVPNTRLSVQAWGLGIEALNQPEIPDFEESASPIDIGTIHLQSVPNLCKGHLGPELRNYMVQQPDLINLQVESVPISVDDNFRFALRLRVDPSGEDFHGFLRSSEQYQLAAARKGDEWELELPDLEKFQSVAPRFRAKQPDGTPLFPARLSLSRVEKTPPFIPMSFGSLLETDSNGEFFVTYNEHRVVESISGQESPDSEPLKIEWQCTEEFTPAGRIPSIGKISCDYGKLSEVSHDFVLAKGQPRAAFRAKLLDRFGKPETGIKGWLCQRGDFPIQVVTDGTGEFAFDGSQGLAFLFLANPTRILPVRIHEGVIEVNSTENLIESTELAKTLSDDKLWKIRRSKFSLEETLRQLIDLGSDLPKEDYSTDVFNIARRYGIETLLDFDTMLVKVAASKVETERELSVLTLANWWLPRDSEKWNALLDLLKTPTVRGEIMYLAANHSTTVEERKGWLLKSWNELKATSHGFLKGRIAIDMLRIGDASFIEQGYAAMVASSDELQGDVVLLQSQILANETFEQQMLRYSVQSPEELHDAIMDQKCTIPSAWLALSYRDEKLAGSTAGLLAKSIARNEYLLFASDQRHWIYERAITIAPELKDDFRLLCGSNRLPFDVLEWMPKNDDLKFDLFRRCIGKIEMQEWAPSDDAGWRLLLEWHRCQVNHLVDRSHLVTQHQSSRAKSLEDLSILAKKCPAGRKDLIGIAALTAFVPNWGSEILQKQDFHYVCMQVQAMNVLYEHAPEIASLTDQLIIEDRTLDDVFAHTQLRDYFWRDFLRYDSAACIEALQKRSKIDLNLDESSQQFRIEHKQLLIRDLILSLRDLRDLPSR